MIVSTITAAGTVVAGALGGYHTAAAGVSFLATRRRRLKAARAFVRTVKAAISGDLDDAQKARIRDAVKSVMSE